MPYSTKQRTRNGHIERLCRYCEAWFPLEKFVRHTKPPSGYLAKCRMCNTDRTRNTRERDRKRFIEKRRMLTKGAA